MDLPLSLIGRVNTIKMNVLPKFMYLFQCIPLSIPKKFFNQLNKVVSAFLWQNKNPRVKLSSLQAPYDKGGLNLPNFRCYYLACQFRPLWIWLHAENSEVRWLSLEQKELGSTPLSTVPFLGSRKCLSVLTKNPIVLCTFEAWQESHKLLGLDISLMRRTPLWDNPNIPLPIADGVLKSWVDKGIRTVGDFYNINIFSNFLHLSAKFNLPNHNLFKYFQLRHWVRDNSNDFPSIPNKSPLEDHLFNTLVSSTKGLISSIYDILNRNLLIYNKLALKQKWEAELQCTYDDADWRNILERAQTVLISTKHRQMQFNIFHMTYFTPVRLHKIDGNISAMCQRCKVNEGNLIHMLWSCPHLAVFWKFVITTVSDVVESEIPSYPRIWILGDISLVNLNFHKKYLISLAGTAGKKIILVNWKADNCPSQRHWLNELTSYCTPEKILYNVRRRPETFNKIWGSFLNALPSISPLG